jgi:tetratricopeptide (TPR) repeat protein
MWRWLIVIWAVFGKCKGKYEEAIAAYQRAIKLKPDSALAHRNLEGLLASRGIGLCGWPPISVLGDMVGFAITEWIVDQKLIRN